MPYLGKAGGDLPALNDADFKIKKDGQDKDVELGAVLWTEFVNPSFK